MLQPIPTDTHDFPEIRENGCIYVDKTAYFHKLITMKNARRAPRRAPAAMRRQPLLKHAVFRQIEYGQHGKWNGRMQFSGFVGFRF